MCPGHGGIVYKMGANIACLASTRNGREVYKAATENKLHLI